MIPTVSISKHLFIYFLHEELTDIENNSLSANGTNAQQSDLLRMFNAVFNALPNSLALDALASSIIYISTSSDKDATKSRKQRKLRTQALCILLQKIHEILGTAFNGRLLIEQLLKLFDVSLSESNIDDYDDIARIVFECALFIVPSTSTQTNFQRITKGQKKSFPLSKDEESSAHSITLETRKDLFLTRKLILNWCVTTFASMFYSDLIGEENQKLEKEKEIASNQLRGHKANKSTNHFDTSFIGAGSPVFSTVLDGHTSPLLFESNVAKRTNYLLKTICCLLFMTYPESNDLAYFLSGGLRSSYDSTLITKDQYHRITICHSHGTNIDDDMLRMILDASNKTITPAFALSLIENMFFLCKEGSTSKLHLQDSGLIWDLYDKLASYEVTPKSNPERSKGDEYKPATKSAKDEKISSSNTAKESIEATR